ncbi:MAG: hypothetical protein KF746_01580 [Chitinophagaceae bacterium]|nr:hypothetical protein [Chitinophagaceae bacterium]
MLATLKSQVFIDTLVLELTDAVLSPLKAVLRDEKGCICSMLETKIEPSQRLVCWKGLNDLPYGIYSLELSCQSAEQSLQLVKRI